MKSWKVLILAACALGLIVAGCGDDDECPSCPSTVGMGYATGSMYLDAEMYLPGLYVYGVGAVPPNIDSVKIGDSLVPAGDIDYEYDEDYHDSYWDIYFDEDGSSDTYMYERGDTAVVRVWGDGRSAVCRLKLMDPDIDSAHITSPVDNADTILPTESSTTYWNEVEIADYYAILVEIRQVYNGEVTWFYKWDYSMDTSYTVTPDMLVDSTDFFWVNVTPFTGPDPRTGASNWTGNLLIGRLFSFGWDDYVRIYVRELVVGTTAKTAVTEENRRDFTPSEIVTGVYNQFK